MPELDQIWNSVTEDLLRDSPAVYYELYFSKMKLVLLSEKKAVIGVFSDFKLDIIKKKFKAAIEASLSHLLGRNITTNFFANKDYLFDPDKYYDRETEGDNVIIDENYIIRPGEDSENDIDFSESVPAEIMQAEEEKYTFDNFIVGSSNKFAHAAALAVAENPARDYNPLFIYGDSGLGKTHLLYAITGYIRKTHPNYNIIYVKSEDFTNEIITGIRTASMEKLREKYRTCDVLLIDDVQFISKKASTQEEYLNTFNTLYEAGKQIILTSDKPPKDIEDLASRLISRFSWGLVADITPPDYDLRIAIMQQKCEQIGIDLSPEVLDFLSSNLVQNVRQLEGAIKKIAARKFLMGESNITIETAKACITDIMSQSGSGEISPDAIFNVVGKKFGVTKEDIIGIARTKEIMEARRVSVYLLKKLADLNYTDISKIIPRNHTSISHLYNAVSVEIKDNSLYERQINSLISEIKNQG